MSTALAILASLGGLVVFVGAVWTIVRAVIRQSEATKANTAALKENTEAIKKLDKRVDQHDIDIALLQEKRRAAPRRRAEGQA